MTDWPEVHARVVETFAKGWSNPHPHAWDDFLAEDVELIQPLLADGAGIEHFRAETRRLLALAPDISGEVLSWAAREDVVFIDLRLNATIGGAPISFRTFDQLRISPDGMLLRREAFFDPSPVALALLRRPSSWLPWWRSGIGPLAARRRLFPGR